MRFEWRSAPFVLPGLSTDVPLQLCPPGGGACTAVALDNDRNATLSSSRTFTELAAGLYELRWQLGAWSEVRSSCGAGSGSSSVTIDIRPGEEVGCQLTITTPTVEIHQAVAGSQHFDFTFCSVATGVCSTANLFNNGDSNSSVPKAFMGDLAPGECTVTQAPAAGWTLTAIECSSPWAVNLAARQVTVTVMADTNGHCSFTNART